MGLSPPVRSGSGRVFLSQRSGFIHRTSFTISLLLQPPNNASQTISNCCKLVAIALRFIFRPFGTLPANFAIALTSGAKSTSHLCTRTRSANKLTLAIANNVTSIGFSLRGRCIPYLIPLSRIIDDTATAESDTQADLLDYLGHLHLMPRAPKPTLHKSLTVTIARPSHPCFAPQPGLHHRSKNFAHKRSQGRAGANTSTNTTARRKETAQVCQR